MGSLNLEPTKIKTLRRQGKQGDIMKQKFNLKIEPTRSIVGQKYNNSTNNSTPIFLGNKVVGHVVGNVFKKRLSKKIHFLRIPPAIANDTSVLKQAEMQGATIFQVIDKDTGDIYTAPIAKIWKLGIRINRGHGEQIYLELCHFDFKSASIPMQQRLF